jgi:hypothetical protein
MTDTYDIRRIQAMNYEAVSKEACDHQQGFKGIGRATAIGLPGRRALD